MDDLATATRSARGEWKEIESADPVMGLLRLAGELDVLAVESARGRRRLFGPSSFAARLLRAGAREMLVLTPRTTE
jgi:hypothetical protein